MRDFLKNGFRHRSIFAQQMFDILGCTWDDLRELYEPF